MELLNVSQTQFPIHNIPRYIQQRQLLLDGVHGDALVEFITAWNHRMETNSGANSFTATLAHPKKSYG